MGHYLKKSVLVASGVILSVLLALAALGRAWTTPGDYVVAWAFGLRNGGSANDIRFVVLLHVGTDALLCFGIFFVIYLLLAKKRGKHEKDQ